MCFYARDDGCLYQSGDPEMKSYPLLRQDIFAWCLAVVLPLLWVVLYSLRVVNDDDNPLPPVARFNGIQCSTAHITEADNSLLYTLSHQHEDHGDSEWVCYTGSGYLIHLDAWQYPVLQLKKRGLSKACRRLVVTLMCRYHIRIIHLDALGEQLSGFSTFAW